MPFMYCSNELGIAQAGVIINNQVLYQCVNHKIQVTCLKTASADNCVNKTLECDVEEEGQDFYCRNSTLLSNSNKYCKTASFYNVSKEFDSASVVNETDINISDYDSVPELTKMTNDNIKRTGIVNVTIPTIFCYQGLLPKHKVSYIPTTTTERSSMTTKQYSNAAKIHLFMLNLIGKKAETNDILNSDTLGQRITPPEDHWVPEALTFPPITTTTTERTITTPEPPYIWNEVIRIRDANGNEKDKLIPTMKEIAEFHQTMSRALKNHPYAEKYGPTPRFTKIYITTTPSMEVNGTSVSTLAETIVSSETFEK